MYVSKMAMSKSVSVGVGKYESVKIDAFMEISLTEKDNTHTVIHDVYEKIVGRLDAVINTQLAEIQGIAKSDSVFLTQKEPTKPAKTRR